MSFLTRKVYSSVTLAVVMSLLLALVVAPAGYANSGSTQFVVRIENISDNSALPGPYAPGVWAVHDTANPLFTANMADYGNGLEALAEDGDPSGLAAALAGQAGVSNSGAFNTPVGAGGPGPILPGDAYQFVATADSTNRYLSFGTMFVFSNDAFFAPDGMGIELFDGADNPVYGDVTNQVLLWDAGTEVNEGPGSGPNQPANGGGAVGATEGGVTQFTNSTRAVPIGSGIATIEVTEVGGDYTITLTNVSGTSGAIDSPIAPVFYATHNDTWALFTGGAPDFGDGLEILAEDGDPSTLVASHTGAAGTDTVGAEGAGGVGTGGSFQFTVTPNATYPYLTIAAMVVATNDGFLAFDEMGVALLDGVGNPRPAGDVEAEMNARLAVWDAGTEANEVPGVGPNQPLNGGPATGAADANNAVRLYADATNDLAGAMLDGRVDVTVTNVGGNDFEISVTNTSGNTTYPFALTPLLWSLHDETASLFEVGTYASPGLESLAEDGDPSTLETEMLANPGVDQAGVIGGAAIGDGGIFVATVTADVDGRFLSVASMVVPSNDTFMAFDPAGVALLDAAGNPRSDSDISADILAELVAWDAGTERNQAGAAGPDQAPVQAGPNTGANEGNGYVRLMNSPDPVWSYPAVDDLVRVTITQLDPTDVTLSGIGVGEEAYPMTPVWLVTALVLLGVIGVTVWLSRPGPQPVKP